MEGAVSVTVWVDQERIRDVWRYTCGNELSCVVLWWEVRCEAHHVSAICRDLHSPAVRTGAMSREHASGCAWHGIARRGTASVYGS
jgi:hypothetical protein